MQPHINFLTLGVADLARSRSFYRALGWRESPASQAAIAFFQAGSLVFALYGRQALAEDAAVAPEGGGFAGFTLAHNVVSEAAVRATLDEAVAAGGRLVRSAGTTEWGGYRGYFADPDDFLWEVCFNPFMPLDAQGAIRLP